MTLELKLITEDDWKQGRQHQESKFTNYYKLNNFHKALENLKNDYTGTISYHKFNKKFNATLLNNTLEYTENSPIFEYFKLSPNSYYLNEFPDDNLWRSCDIDSSVYSLFQDTNKYKQSPELFIFDKPYILFTLQSNGSKLVHSFNAETFIRIVMWATTNKKYILFKLHPYHFPNSNIETCWKYLDKKGYISDYVMLVDKRYNLDHLIKNAEQVWTFSSGAGMQAVIYNKPVAHFWKNVDFFPVANFVTTPEEAYLTKKPSNEDITRFLTWYFTKLTINSESVNLEKRLRHRLEQYFVYKQSDISQIL